MSPAIHYTPEAYIVVIIGDEDGGQAWLYNLVSNESQPINNSFQPSITEIERCPRN